MNPDDPFMSLFGKTSKLDVLQFLIAEPNDYYNITRLAGILDMHRDTVSGILSDFQEFDLVEYKQKGKAKCYRLNGNSKIVRGLDILVAGIIDETGPDMNLFESSIDAFKPQGVTSTIYKFRDIFQISMEGTLDNYPWDIEPVKEGIPAPTAVGETSEWCSIEGVA